MDLRIGYLDEEGFAAQVLYPTMGLLWESTVDDPQLADALCRAYNTWAFELVAGHKDRLFPAAHISMRDAALAVREMARVARLGCRTIFVGADADRRTQLRQPGLRSNLGGGAGAGPRRSASISSAIPTTPAASGTAPAILASCTSR